MPRLHFVTFYMATFTATNCCKNNIRLGANGRKNSVYKINTKHLITDENINLDQQLEKFWTIESYGTHSIGSSIVMFKKERKRTLDSLEKTTVKNSNCYEVGLLWKNEETKLPYNRDVAVDRAKSVENKCNGNPEITTKQKETANC